MYFYLIGYAFLNAIRAITTLNTRPYTVVFYSLFIILFMVTAFRFQVGCDWAGYYFNYEMVESLPANEVFLNSDVAWWALLLGIVSLDLPYPVANIVPAIILFWGLWHLAKNQPDPMTVLIFAVPIIVMGLGMSGIRQGAALGLLCFAFTALRNGRLLRFTLFVLAATLWHSSAIAFIILLPFVITRDIRRRLLLLALLTVPAALILLSTSAADVAFERYTGEDASSAAGAPVRLGVAAVTGLFYLFFLRPKWKAVLPSDSAVMTIFALAMVASPALIPVSSVIADRLGYYVMIPQIVILGSVPYFLKGRTLFAAQVFAFSLMAGYIFVWAGFSSMFEQCYVPYQTWIGGMPSTFINKPSG